MSEWTITTGCDTPDKTVDDEEDATESANVHATLCEDCGDGDVEIIEENGVPDGGAVEVVDENPSEDASGVSPAALAQDPIDWLEGKNAAFVNTISGTPAISKQGFRYIQQQFGITTESEVVETFDDPLGVVVWAKAERPDGQSAEAHGEGYQFEGDLRDNEFVRYADTRAKNRAISDLTSAGALAVSELTNTPEGDR